MNEAVHNLATLTTSRDADQYLVARNLRKAELLQLARRLNVAVSNRDTNDELRRKIIASTVDVRQDAAARKTTRGPS